MATSSALRSSARTHHAPLGGSRVRKITSRNIVGPRLVSCPVGFVAAETVEYGVAEYPEPGFCADVLSRFPEDQIATTFEARVLLANNWKWLDVRSTCEYEEGYVPGSVNVPLINAVKRWDSEVNDKVFVQTVNRDFVADVLKKLPDKATPIMVGCSDGMMRTIPALEALDEAGYTKLVAVKGGFLRWTSVYDNKLQRRREDNFKEVYNGDGRDSAGIHGTGASFENIGAIEKLPFRDHTEWVDWWEEMDGVDMSAVQQQQPDYSAPPAQQQPGYSAPPAQPAAPPAQTSYANLPDFNAPAAPVPDFNAPAAQPAAQPSYANLPDFNAPAAPVPDFNAPAAQPAAQPSYANLPDFNAPAAPVPDFNAPAAQPAAQPSYQPAAAPAQPSYNTSMPEFNAPAAQPAAQPSYQPAAAPAEPSYNHSLPDFNAPAAQPAAQPSYQPAAAPAQPNYNTSMPELGGW
ncbi:rhodanese domain-containing protein [Pycnococcus provasolii]